MLHTTRRSAAFTIIACAVLVLGAFGPRHMRLVKSFPEKDQVLSQAPDHIQLWFSQNPEVALTRVRLVGEGETKVDLGKATGTEDPKSVVLTLPQPLEEGSYTVVWQTAAPDGHKVKGEFAFRYEAEDSDTDAES